MGELVRFEVTDGVGLIRLDRPPANAFDLEMASQLEVAVHEAGDRDDVGAIVVWGGPTIFAAGADITAMATSGSDEVRPQVDALGRACDLLEELPKVSIAAVNGYALGGGLEVALACDLRYVADDAKLGQPEIRLGVIPGAGGTQRLVPLIGVGRARDLVYTGRQVRGPEAFEMGLAERVVAAPDVLATASAEAAAFAAGPRQALAAAKLAIHRAAVEPGPRGIDAERTLFLSLFGTHDQREGMAAFLEKRPPRFGAAG